MMKLDFDCVRDILLEAEDFGLCEYCSASDLAQSMKYDLETIMYTIKILSDGGYIVANVDERFIMPLAANKCDLISMTFKGHEYLNAVRNKTVWENFKNAAKTKVLPFTLEIVQHICSQTLAALLQQQLIP